MTTYYYIDCARRVHEVTLFDGGMGSYYFNNKQRYVPLAHCATTVTEAHALTVAAMKAHAKRLRAKANHTLILARKAHATATIAEQVAAVMARVDFTGYGEE